MREDVWVSVSGFSDADPDPVRDCCAGIFLRTGSADCVRYEQKDEDGAGTAVLLRIEKDRVTVTRRGAVESSMVFRAGERHLCSMKASGGCLEFDVVTTALETKRPGYDQLIPDRQIPGQRLSGQRLYDQLFPVHIRAEYRLETGGTVLSEHVLEICITGGDPKQ